MRTYALQINNEPVVEDLDYFTLSLALADAFIGDTQTIRIEVTDNA